MFPNFYLPTKIHVKKKLNHCKIIYFLRGSGKVWYAAICRRVHTHYHARDEAHGQADSPRQHWHPSYIDTRTLLSKRRSPRQSDNINVTASKPLSTCCLAHDNLTDIAHCFYALLLPRIRRSARTHRQPTTFRQH